MKNPSWWEEPPEDEPEAPVDENELDYGDDQAADLDVEAKAEKDLYWDTPTNAPFNNTRR